MDNILLGKAVKAMYKLSGKTLPQLADETGLTLDTINNLFYARLQKPGYFGVASFVKAAGFTMTELDGFLAQAKGLPEDADFVEAFTKYMLSVENAGISVPGTEIALPVTAKNAHAAENGEPDSGRNMAYQIQILNEQHERQLDRFRSTHVNYVEQLKESYQEQISQLTDNNVKLKEHYDHSVSEIKKSHERELLREKEELKHARRMNLVLTVCIVAEAIAMFVLGLCLMR